MVSMDTKAVATRAVRYCKNIAGARSEEWTRKSRMSCAKELKSAIDCALSGYQLVTKNRLRDLLSSIGSLALLDAHKAVAMAFPFLC